MNFLDSVPMLAALGPVLAVFLAEWWDHKRRVATEKPPQEEKLLRPPGYSLALRFDELSLNLLVKLFWATIACAQAGVFIAPAARIWAMSAPITWHLGAGLAVLIPTVVGVRTTITAFRSLREIQNIRLGLRGEQAVAEVLHEVADCGYRVFHDLPGGADWNIDHVAVGSRGVFLIETKARRRRSGKRNQPKHVVEIDGDCLWFPAGEDRNAIPQARRNTCWLSNYLSKKTGESVCVEPLVAIPGWFVETGKIYPPKAMNGKYLTGYLRKQEEKIPPAQLRRIITALDEKCRDVEF
jgi:hypothetical protein